MDWENSYSTIVIKYMGEARGIPYAKMAYQLNLLQVDWTSLHVDQQPVEAMCVSYVCTLV